MPQMKNVEDWNPSAEHVYARRTRLGPAERPFMEPGETVDMADLRERLPERRIRALFLQGYIVPAQKKTRKPRAQKPAAASAPAAPVSRFADVSTADLSTTPEE